MGQLIISRLSILFHRSMCLFYARTLLFWLLQLFSIDQSTNESLIVEAAGYSRKINEGEARKPGWSPQFSRSVVSDSLWPHESQHTRPPCPSPTPGVHSDSRPLSQWCHPAISSYVVPFSSCPQSLPASGSFQWVNSSHEVAKVLEFQLYHHSCQITPRTDRL